MNFMHIAGHLGADPEVRFTSSGKKVTTLRVATRTRKGQVDDTIWWRVTIWGDQYDNMMPFFKKGSSIMVSGELRKPEIFNDREGKPQISMEITASYIQFSPFGKPGAASAGASSFGGQTASHDVGAPPSGGFSSPLEGSFSNTSKGESFDDEVPF